jgi:hypothetical protein
MTIIPIALAAAAPVSPGAASPPRDLALNNGPDDRRPSARGEQATRLGDAPRIAATARPSATATAESKPAALTSPLLQASHTLPAGVSFVEEPSGIKIYVNNEQIRPSLLPSVDFDGATAEVD